MEGGDILLFRVPEDKCHMVLPEIEEEAEEETKLSLTSLLLGEYHLLPIFESSSLELIVTNL